jgi:hypothetical protein
MEYLAKLKREKLEAEAERLYGNDILLKTCFMLEKTGASSAEIGEAMLILHNDALALAKEVEEKMEYTLDLSGNIVPIKTDVPIEPEPQQEENIEINISE